MNYKRKMKKEKKKKKEGPISNSSGTPGKLRTQERIEGRNLGGGDCSPLRRRGPTVTQKQMDPRLHPRMTRSGRVALRRGSQGGWGGWMDKNEELRDGEG
jgi:hypothetical protein